MLLATSQLKRTPLKNPTNPYSEKDLSRILDPHARSVSVGQPQDRRLELIYIVIQGVIRLTRDLVDSIHIDWVDRVIPLSMLAPKGHVYAFEGSPETTLALQETVKAGWSGSISLNSMWRELS